MLQAILACGGPSDIRGVESIVDMILARPNKCHADLFQCFCCVAQCMSTPELRARLKMVPGAGLPQRTEQFTWTTLVHNMAFAFTEDVDRLCTLHPHVAASAGGDVATLVSGKILEPYLPRMKW